MKDSLLPDPSTPATGASQDVRTLPPTAIPPAPVSSPGGSRLWRTPRPGTGGRPTGRGPSRVWGTRERSQTTRLKLSPNVAVKRLAPSLAAPGNASR